MPIDHSNLNNHLPNKRKPIPVGVDDFADMATGGYLFCDKTLMIKELLEKKGDIVTLITRPRRWGKSLNMSMLHYFFAPEVNGQTTKGLFQNLKIADYPDCIAYQGQYPVIFISFKDI